MKLLIIAVLILTLLSCGVGKSKHPFSEALACTNAPEDFDSTTIIAKPDSMSFHLPEKSANDAAITKVLIHQMLGYGDDSVFARQAAQLLEKVINSQAFRSSVIVNSYNEHFDYSTQQIYDLITNAHEPVGAGGQDHVIDLYLRVIDLEDDGEGWMEHCEPGSRARTIGIDGAGTGIAAVCPQWLHSMAQKRKPSSLAAHFIHEYMHVLGFVHAHQKSKSVPYKIQYIVENLGAQYDPQ
jgi:hypothetical protein